MLGRPGSARAGGDAAFGSARHWPARGQTRSSARQAPARMPTRLKPPLKPAWSPAGDDPVAWPGISASTKLRREVSRAD
jgi:hypothetical protein